MRLRSVWPSFMARRTRKASKVRPNSATVFLPSVVSRSAKSPARRRAAAHADGCGKSSRFGSSVQHLAFATADIFATADALKARGFAPLPIPANYYDDIEARFTLADGLADRLRAGSILYDRDEHGEYFQLYSNTYGDGFFVEIVERRGGYRGYGAANAPFRVAAQQRAAHRLHDAL